MYKYYFLDLDGTLMDSEPGIINSLKYALSRMNVEFDPDTNFRSLIGFQLNRTFENIFNLSTSDAASASAYYREYYLEKGMHESTLYPGVEKTLRGMADKSKSVSLATLKLTDVAENCLKHYHLDHYFENILGSSPDNTLSAKKDIIKSLLDRYKSADLSEFLMAGDRKSDIEGAAENGICSCGVLYGYGTADELHGADYKIMNFEDILKL